MFVPGTQLDSQVLVIRGESIRMANVVLFFSFPVEDFETSRKETKVRLRGHELRQAHHSSAKAEEVKGIIRAFPCTAGSGGDNPFFLFQKVSRSRRHPRQPIEC